jgi:lysophospholipid acyltransferase (LPLAT)-like uncharacterized protein
MRELIGHLLGWLVRAWAFTWRTELVIAAETPWASEVPLVFAFWHGQQMGLMGVRRRRPIAALVSWSRDGEWQTGVMRSLGISVLRGSSSRGGSVGLRRIVRAIRRGHDAAFAVDGPRGPLGRPKPGAAEAALLGGALLVPVAGAASRRCVLAKSWDRFELPLPFARVAVVVGRPLDEAEAARHAGALGRAIDRARQVALDRVFA